MEIIIGIIGSALVSWLITHIYYKKSLNNQSSETQKEITGLLQVLQEQQHGQNEIVVSQQRLEDSINEYRRAGTPVQVIDTFTDLTDAQKADLYDAVMMRVKGRLGKSNKYRK